jgi:hypothetical protein
MNLKNGAKLIELTSKQLAYMDIRNILLDKIQQLEIEIQVIRKLTDDEDK